MTTKEEAANIIYEQIKGQSKNLGTVKSFQTGAAGSKKGGFGSVDAVMRNMAGTLADAGLTSIDQIGVGSAPTYGNVFAKPEFRDDGFTTYPTGAWYYDYSIDQGDSQIAGPRTYLSDEEVARQGLYGYEPRTVSIYMGDRPAYINKTTGALMDLLNNGGSAALPGESDNGWMRWGRTKAGEGDTYYGLKFDESTGLPIFQNMQGENENADLLTSLALITSALAPQIGAALLPAGASAAAALALGSAVSGFIGSGGSIEAGVKAGLSGFLGGQAGSWASNATNSALVGNIANNMTRTMILGGDPEKALVTSLIQAAPAEISKYIPNFSSLPRAAQEAAVAATVDLMRSGGENLDQIALTGVAKGATDYAVSQIEGYNNLRPAQKEVIRTGLSNALQGKDLTNELIQGAIGLGQEGVQNEIKNDSAKKAGWSDYATQQAAQSVYGSKVTPDQYADKQETTEEEAKKIAGEILGREPTEFEYMQLIGLTENAAAENEDLKSVRYNESTFDSDELAQAYKAVYGKEPTDEWMAENIDLLGRSDAQGKNMLQNLYVDDKNNTTFDEAQTIWEGMGNTRPMTTDELAIIAGGTEGSAEAISKNAFNLDMTIFNGRDYETPQEAAEAAGKAGMTEFFGPDGQMYKVLTPVQEGKIKDEVAKAATFNEAFAEARQKLGAGKTFEFNGKQYTTDYAATNKAVPFDGSKSATKEDAAKLAVANGKLTFTHGGKMYGLDMQTASTIASSQNQSEAETNRLLRQAIKPANESTAETLRLLSSGTRGTMDTVSTVLANTFGTTAQGLGQLVQSFGDAYSLATGETLGNAVYKAGQAMESYGKEKQVYGADVQTERMEQVRKIANEAGTEFERIQILAEGAGKYPLGFWGDVGKEFGQEAPTVLTGLATSVAMIMGAPLVGTLKAASLASAFFETVEVFGAEGASVERDLLRKGVAPEKARDAALIQGTFAAAITFPTEFIADKLLMGSWFGGLSKATVGAVVSGGARTVGAQMAAEMMQTYPTTLSSQYLTTGQIDPNAALTATYYAAMISGGTTGTLIAPTSIRDAAVIAKDYNGNDVTWGEFTSGTKIPDLKTLDLSVQIGESADGDAVTMGTLTAAPVGGVPSYEFLKDVLPASVTNQNYIVGTDASGNPVTLDMLTSEVKSDVSYDAVFNNLLDVTPSQRTSIATRFNGDVNAYNTAKTSADAAMRIATKKDPLDLRYDVNKDGRVTSADAFRISKGEQIRTDIDASGVVVPVAATPPAATPPAEAPAAPPAATTTVTPAEVATTEVTTPAATPPAGGEVVAVDPNEGTALVVDGAGNVNVVDNTSGTLVAGDTIPAAPPAPPPTPPAADTALTETPPATNTGTATSTATPPATGEVVSVDQDNGTALVIDGAGNVNVVDNTGGTLATGDTVDTTASTGGGTVAVDQGGGADLVVDNTGSVDVVNNTGGTPPGDTVATDTTATNTTPTAATKQDVTDAVDTYMAANPGLSAADVTTAITTYMAANPGLTKADLSAAISAATNGLATTSQVAAVQTDVDALETLIGTPASKDTAGTGVIGQLEAMGATNTQIGNLVGTPATKDSPATGLYKTAEDAAVRGENAATAVQTELSKVIGNASVKDDPNTLDVNEALAATGLFGQIEASQAQTQQQLDTFGADVNKRINELMKQGQTYQQATQQAIGELTQSNQDLKSLVGTQGRTANQSDIDAMSEMLGGDRDVDLSYDVTGDKQITQADIDFLTQVVSGVKTDYTPPAGSFLGPTGLYGQLAANEAKRAAELSSWIERERERDRIAKEAADEAVRQGKISNAKQNLGQSRQVANDLSQQLPGIFQTTNTPLYGTMEYFDPFGDPFADPFGTTKMRAASSTNPADQTKMAAGGYIDDLLAGDMTVDDLLNLLR